MAIENNPSMAAKTSQGAQGYAYGEPSLEVAAAAKMGLVLDQPMADVSTYLVNRDFEGDFFKIGDTVSIVKPDPTSLVIDFGDINTGNGTAGTGNDTSKDNKLTPREVSFTKQILTIDQYVKYAFVISDIVKAEGKWNYESGNLDLTAQEIRKRHNRKTLETILNDTRVKTVKGLLNNSASQPAAIEDGDDLYQRVIVPMFAQLYNAGAITADGQVTYGSNPQEGKATHACLFVPTDVYTSLLLSHYLQDRATVAADEKVQTGKVKTIMGMDIMIEPSLDKDAKHSVNVAGLASGTFCIVAGTRNAVTRAGKVLPPEKQRSQTRFADEFHGLEIYGERVIEPDAVVKAFITL